MVYKIFLRGKTGYIVNFPRGKAGYIVDFPGGMISYIVDISPGEDWLYRRLSPRGRLAI